MSRASGWSGCTLLRVRSSVVAKAQIKCVEDETSAAREGPPPPCIGCRNLAIDCTYDYVKKKPGRKNA